MKFPFLITAALLLAAGAYAVGSTSQDKKGESAGHAQDAGAGMMDQIPPWMMVQPEHKVLAKKAGHWKFKIKMDSPEGPQEMEGTSDMKLIYEGRYLEDSTKSTFMGMPFEGRGYTGYDVIKKKYVGTWMDSMSTAIAVMEGTYDEKTKTFDYKGEMPDMTGKYAKYHVVEKMVDDDHWTSNFYMVGPDGKDQPHMTFEYTRVR